MTWHTGNKRLLWQHLTTMVIDKIRKMSIKGVKLKSESFFSISPGVLELWRKNLRGRIPPPRPDRVNHLKTNSTKLAHYRLKLENFLFFLLLVLDATSSLNKFSKCTRTKSDSFASWHFFPQKYGVPMEQILLRQGHISMDPVYYL